MKSTLVKLFLSAILVIGAGDMVGTKTAFAARDCVALGCNDFVQANLRADLLDIYNSDDYEVLIQTSGQGNAPGTYFTTGWLAVWLAQYNGQTDSGKFTQVGIKTNSSGTFWFVYAESGVYCQLGTQIDSRTCQGAIGQFVSPNNWDNVELLTYVYDGIWRARVFDSGGTAHEVAQIYSASSRIYAKVNVTTEEAYATSSDPHYTAYFYYKHPKYLAGGVWHEWATSVGGVDPDNDITVYDIEHNNTFCSQYYGMNPYVNGDSRAWYAGSNAQQCQWLLFPSSVTYEPDIRTVNGWRPAVTVLNNATSPARVDVAYFDSAGSLCDLSNLSLSGQASQSFGGCPGISAIVNADRDVRTVVQNSYNDGNRALDRAYPGETQPATTV